MRTFPIGGIHPSDNKSWSKDKAIEVMALPDEVVIPLIQHIGAPTTPVVAKGDKVLTGQLIAQSMGFVSANIHSPISGTVKSIDLYPNGQGLLRQAIIIKREGDEWVEGIDRSPELKRECTLTPTEIVSPVSFLTAHLISLAILSPSPKFLLEVTSSQHSSTPNGSTISVYLK
mgnify:CR=1 FL=1